MASKEADLVRARYATDPAYKALILARRRRHYARTREAKIAYQIEYRRWHPEKLAAYRDRVRGSPKQLLRGARQRAKRFGLPFDLSAQDVIVPTHCPVLGLRLECGRGTHHAASPTLDRIVPALGYVKGNVAVISLRANMIKSDATAQELERIAAWLQARQRVVPTPCC